MKQAKLQTLPAETDKECSCCGRKHRKLYLWDGYWMGRNCLEDYELYKIWPDVNTLAWSGYESKYNKVRAMVTGK